MIKNLLKNPILTGLMLALFVSLFSFAGNANAGAIPYESLIKGSSQTIYWYAADGKRYVFPNEGTYKSWYGQDFSQVIVIPDSSFAGIPLAGNVTYKPGARLIKISTDPKVYSVSQNGVLRWIPTESLAQQVAGINWNRQIDDVPATYFNFYTIGEPISIWNYSDILNDYSSIYIPSDSLPNVENVYHNKPVITYPYQNEVLPSYPREFGVGWESNSQSHEIELMCDYCDSSYKWGGIAETIYTGNYQTSFFFDGNFLPGDNEYRVRVRSLDGYNIEWSDWRYFSVDTNNYIPEDKPLVITYPYQNQVLNNYPRSLTLTWDSPYQMHEIEYACDICSTNGNWDSEYLYTDNYETYFVIDNHLYGDNEFRFRIRSLDHNGQTGQWSEYRYFSFDTSVVSSPNIIYPYQNEVLSSYPREFSLGWESNSKSHEIELMCDYCTSSYKWGGISDMVYTDNYQTSYFFNDNFLSGDNEYRARVRGLDGYDTNWSEWRYFSFDTSNYIQEDKPLVITYPLQNQVLRSYPRELTLYWDSPYQMHEIEYACDVCSTNGNWNPEYLYTDNYDTYFTVNNHLYGDNEFRFRVRTLYHDGSVGSWSKYRYFSFDTSAPNIIYPYQNQYFTNYPREFSLGWGSNEQRHEIELMCDYCTSSYKWGGVTDTIYTNNYETSYFFDSSFLPGDNEYRTRVRKLGFDNASGPWSEWVYFSF